MKTINVLLIGLFVILLSSCSKDSDGGDGGFDPSDCDMGNGLVTASISGSSNYRLECALGGYSEIQGVKGLSIVNLNIPDISGGLINFEDYIAIGAALPGTADSGCESDFPDFQIGSITYWEDVTIAEGEKVEDHPGFFRGQNENVDICFDELTATRAVGTFSGTLTNYLGETKTITNGQFDFKF